MKTLHFLLYIATVVNINGQIQNMLIKMVNGLKQIFYKRFDTLDELKKFVENYEEAENRYYFSEDNRESLPEIMDKTFTENQLKEVYRDVINKEEYHDFQEWFFDMLRSGLILYIKEEAKCLN